MSDKPTSSKKGAASKQEPPIPAIFVRSDPFSPAKLPAVDLSKLSFYGKKRWGKIRFKNLFESDELRSSAKEEAAKLNVARATLVGLIQKRVQRESAIVHRWKLAFPIVVASVTSASTILGGGFYFPLIGAMLIGSLVFRFAD